MNTAVSGVAMVYAMEIGMSPQAMTRYAEKICGVDLKSIEGVKAFENWRKVWDDLHFEPTVFYTEHMQTIHAGLVKRLAAKGLLDRRSTR